MDRSHSLAPAAAAGSLSVLLVGLAQHLRAPELPLRIRCPARTGLPIKLLARLQLDLLCLVIGIALVLGLLLWPLFELVCLWQACIEGQNPW